MSYQRLAYDDAATPGQMATDCVEVDRALHLSEQRSGGSEPAVAAGPFTTVEVSDDLAALAGGLALHLG